MDKFYKQFFGKDEYPPDKKEERFLDDESDDELDSTIDDRSSHVNEKYHDLHSLNLGPPPNDKKPLDGNDISPKKPRETYLRADNEDEMIMPKKAVPLGEAEWPPKMDDTMIPDLSKPPRPPSPKEKYPRLTFYGKEDEKPREERPMPPPGVQRRPPPHEMNRRPPPDMQRRPPPDMQRRPPPHDMRRPPPDMQRRPPPHDTRRPPPHDMRRPPPDMQRRPPHDMRRLPGQMSEKMPPPGYPGGRRRRMQQMIMPYVGKWGKISRSWASQTVILIVFMGVGYIMMSAGIQHMADDSVAYLNAGCAAVDTAADAVVNAPSTAALATLSMIDSAARNAVNALGNSINKVITILRDLIVFVLKMFVGTFICFATLIVKTALTMISEAGRILTEQLEKAVNEVVGDLQNVAATISSGIEDAANNIANFFTGNKGGDKKVDFNTDSIKQKLTISIPTDWTDSISNIANKIPSEDQIFGNITQLIDVPFGMLRSLVVTSFSSVNISIADDVDIATGKKANVCVHPMGQETVSEFGAQAARIIWIAGLVLVAVALLMVLFNALWTMREESRFQRRLVDFRSELVDYRAPVSKRELHEKPATRKEMDLFVLPGEPMLQRMTDYIVRKKGDTERTAAWRWWLNYVWHPPAIACFVAGALGLATIIVQIKAIEALRLEFIPLLAHEIRAFEQNALSDDILGGARQESIDVASSINAHINSTQQDLTDALFGPLSQGTGNINDTLNDFVSTYISGIRDVFGGTPLQDPIEGLMNCTITKHIQSIQKLLTFVNDFAQDIELPRVSANVLYAPVAALAKPLNLTAKQLRVLAVGYYIPDADELDPQSFSTGDRMQALLDQYRSENLEKISSYGEEAFDTMSSSDLADSAESESFESVADDLDSGETAGPVADGGTGQLRKRQEPVDATPAPPADFQVTGLLPDLPVGYVPDTYELGNMDDDESDLYSLSDIDWSSDSDSVEIPTSELYRDEVENAQEFQGYTGGLIDKLCDSYINNLKGDIPTMIALMLVWIIIAIIGAVKVARDYSTIRKFNLR
ncbi:plasma membrane fusion protein prm1 [Coemansia sp. RSA 989]|nr:plasma membrane fusion protein prm1 [Coemansia sp. RSA 989]